MKNLARLASLLSLAIFAVGLMASSSASATGYLLLPVGGTILGTVLASTLANGNNSISCSTGQFTTTIASVHLIGPFVVNFSGCTSKGAEKSGCVLNSPGNTGGLITIHTLHALIGLGLPGRLPALLILPTANNKFVTFESNECTVESTLAGKVIGLLLQKPGVAGVENALLDFTPGDPESIDLPLGGSTKSTLELFGAAVTFATIVHLLYPGLAELMP